MYLDFGADKLEYLLTPSTELKGLAQTRKTRNALYPGDKYDELEEALPT